MLCVVLALLASIDAFKRGEKGKYKKLAEQKAAAKPRKELKVEVLVSTLHFLLSSH